MSILFKNSNSKNIREIDHKLNALAYSNSQLNPDIYYGWCRTCEKPNEIAERKCITDAPKLNNYECINCVNKNSESITTKSCPKCSACIEKISGCNHIECTSCGCHWCWECGIACESFQATYTHMWNTHNRIYENTTVNNYDDDDDGDE